MQDNIPDALIAAFERQYDTSWNDPQLRNERMAMRYGWAAAMESKQCLVQIGEPAPTAAGLIAACRAAEAEMAASAAVAVPDEREAFEKWARQQPWIKDCQRDSKGVYGHYESQKAWATWKQARTAPCLHQIQEPDAAEQAAWHAGLDEGRAQAAPAAVAVADHSADWRTFFPWWDTKAESMKDVYRFEGLKGVAYDSWKAALAATPAAAQTHAEAAAALCINSALTRIRAGNHAEAIEPLEHALRALAAASDAPEVTRDNEPANWSELSSRATRIAQEFDRWIRAEIADKIPEGESIFDVHESPATVRSMQRWSALQDFIYKHLVDVQSKATAAAPVVLPEPDAYVNPSDLSMLARKEPAPKNKAWMFYTPHPELIGVYSVHTLRALLATGGQAHAERQVFELTVNQMRQAIEFATGGFTPDTEAELETSMTFSFGPLQDDDGKVTEFMHCWYTEMPEEGAIPLDECPTEKDLAAAQAPQQADARDADGEAFRTAARLGLTLRFYGNCAQSGLPGAPSVYEVTAGPDSAEAMRASIDRAAIAIAAAKGEQQ